MSYGKEESNDGKEKTNYKEYTKKENHHKTEKAEAKNKSESSEGDADAKKVVETMSFTQNP